MEITMNGIFCSQQSEFTSRTACVICEMSGTVFMFQPRILLAASCLLAQSGCWATVSPLANYIQHTCLSCSLLSFKKIRRLCKLFSTVLDSWAGGVYHVTMMHFLPQKIVLRGYGSTHFFLASTAKDLPISYRDGQNFEPCKKIITGLLPNTMENVNRGI